MKLPGAAAQYDRSNENQTRTAIQKADGENYKRGQDMEIQAGQRVFFTDPDGRRYRVTLDEAGLFTAAPVDESGLGIVAAEALSAGDLCNIYSSSGVAKIQKADATDASKPANSFVLAAFSLGDVVTPHYIGQANTALSSLTPGATYWLDTTPGGITSTPPASSGADVVIVGTALTDTILLFHPQRTVSL